MPRPKRLIKKPKEWQDFKVVNYALRDCAIWIEANLIAGGAVAERDYTIVDIFNLAALMCVEAQLSEMLARISNYSTVVDNAEDTEESKDIKDAEKPKLSARFHNVGYQ